MKHATSRTLFSYWDALRGERAAPERGEIEPGQIRHILADTFILEVGEARSAEIRLAGTRLCALFGRELKGVNFHALWPDQPGTEATRLTDMVLDETAGLVVGLLGITEEEATVDLEMILLPLRHRGRTHARILGAMSPAAVPSWIGYQAITRLTTTSLRVIWPAGRPPSQAPSSDEDHLDKRRRFIVHRGGRP